MSSDNPVNYTPVYRPHKPFVERAFDSSAFDLGKFSGRLTLILDALAEGAVIAIDAPWGHGKTFFARNYDANLRANGWKTVYVDAFAHDYFEDPFLLLAALVKEHADSPKKTGFVNAAIAVGKTLIPTAGKAAAKVITGGLIDGEASEAIRKAVTDAAGDAAQKIVESRIAEFEKGRRDIETFKEKVSEVADHVFSETKHPLVVFMDELDRCRPDFAVRTLERIKHLFDVPHLAFVLLLNKEQLENAVNGVYGGQLDAASYLRKFIHLTLPLPVRSSSSDAQDSELRKYPAHLARRVNLGANQKLLSPFTRALSEFAGTMGLSFRDVERCFTEFVVLPLNPQFAEALVEPLAFAIILKVRYPSLLERLLAKDPSAKDEVVESLLGKAAAKGLDVRAVGFLDALLTAHIGRQLTQEQQGYVAGYRPYFRGDARVFAFLAGLVDARFSTD